MQIQEYFNDLKDLTQDVASTTQSLLSKRHHVTIASTDSIDSTPTWTQGCSWRECKLCRGAAHKTMEGRKGVPLTWHVGKIIFLPRAPNCTYTRLEYHVWDTFSNDHMIAWGQHYRPFTMLMHICVVHCCPHWIIWLWYFRAKVSKRLWRLERSK